MKSGLFMLLSAIISCPLLANAQSAAPAVPSVQQQTQAAKPPASQQSSKAADKKDEDCGCEAKNTPAHVAAIANGVTITTKEIDDQIAGEKAGLQKQIVEARRRELNLQINSRLLEAEARRKGTTATRLLEQEVVDKVKEPTDVEVQAFYTENKARIPGPFKEFRQ